MAENGGDVRGIVLFQTMLKTGDMLDMLSLSGAVYKKCVQLEMLSMLTGGGKIPSQKGTTFNTFNISRVSNILGN